MGQVVGCSETLGICPREMIGSMLEAGLCAIVALSLLRAGTYGRGVVLAVSQPRWLWC